MAKAGKSGPSGAEGLALQQAIRACLEKFEAQEQEAFAERELTTTKIAETTDLQITATEKLHEMEGLQHLSQERGESLKEEISHMRKVTDELQAAVDSFVSNKNALMNRIMTLELERQHKKRRAREAQQAMVHALWYKKAGVDTPRPASSQMPWVTPPRATTAPAPADAYVKRYGSLVSGGLKDFMELDMSEQAERAKARADPYAQFRDLLSGSRARVGNATTQFDGRNGRGGRNQLTMERPQTVGGGGRATKMRPLSRSSSGARPGAGAGAGAGGAARATTRGGF